MRRLMTLSLILLLVFPLKSQDLYDVNSITVIELSFEESNWDAILDAYKAADEGERLLASAVINGEAYDSVGVRFKGNSTYSSNNAKNPLNISLDYVKDQNYNGYETLKLSNGKNDPSFVREVLSYAIVGKYMKAPYSNYAKVYINGSYYGLFSSSEAINKDFMDSKLYVDTDNTRFKCNPSDTNNGGSSLSYLGTDSASYYDYYELKSDAGWKDLIALTYAIENTPSAIEDYLDIDHAIWMLAFNNVTVNLDSYTGAFRQNYYLIKDDNERFIPIIWDLNESLGAFEMIDSGSSSGGGMGGPGGGGPGGGGAPGSSSSSSLDELDLFLREDDSSYPLLKLIFDNDRYKKMYVAHCKTILEENFSNGWYEAKADSLQDLIADDLADDPNAFYSTSQFTGNISSTQDGVIGITELMSSRISYLESLDAFNYEAPTIGEITVPEAPEPYTNIDVTVEVENADYVQVAYRHSKDEAFTKLEMYDDGQHNDGEANDGLYGISFEVDESNTHYYFYAENSDAGIFSPQRAEKEYYKISAEAAVAIDDAVVINEIMASNSNIALDEMDEYDDWIELFNNSTEEVSLSGYYLSDDDEDIMQWAFPDTVINAQDYLIVWADKDEEQGSMHANFKLSASGEALYLVNADLEIVNALVFGEQTTDIAYARNPNGTGDFYFQGPTFSFNNEDTQFQSLEDAVSSSWDLYPNPVLNKLTVNTQDKTVQQYALFNALGQEIEVPLVSSGQYLVLDMSALKSGLYLLVVEADNNAYRFSVIKQ